MLGPEFVEFVDRSSSLVMTCHFTQCIGVHDAQFHGGPEIGFRGPVVLEHFDKLK